MMLDLVNHVWVDEDGESFCVTNALDAEGDETDIPAEVRAIVIAMPGGSFGVVDMADFAPVTLH